MIFVGLSAFQTLPTLRLMAESSRGEGITYEQAIKGSIRPPHLWTILFPNAFADIRNRFSDGLSGSLWEKCPYVGLLLAVAAPLALASRSRRYVVLFGFVAMVSLAFAFAEDLPGLLHPLPAVARASAFRLAYLPCSRSPWRYSEQWDWIR